MTAPLVFLRFAKPNKLFALDMAARTPQTSYISNHSQSDYHSDDDTTTGNVDHQPATTSNRDPGAHDIVIERAASVTQDNSDTNNPLEDIMLDLREAIDGEILGVVERLASMDALNGGAYQESLREALDRVDHVTSRKEHYKLENERLTKENKLLKKLFDASKAKADTLQAATNAARERALNIFK